jgi:hypothetical protein
MLLLDTWTRESLRKGAKKRTYLRYVDAHWKARCLFGVGGRHAGEVVASRAQLSSHSRHDLLLQSQERTAPPYSSLHKTDNLRH